MMGFSQTLRSEASAIWEKIFAHPFLVEMSRGTLPLPKFRFYLKQDHAYLKDFCRFLGWAVAKSGTLEQMRWFSDLLSTEFTMEIEMQRNLASRVGLSLEELESAEPAPTTTAYTSYLINVATTGSLGEIVAAMSPCFLSYMEIGERLMSREAAGKVEVYREWCSTYTSGEAKDLARQIESLLDRLGEVAGAEEREKMRKQFLVASRLEYMFWDMAYRLEGWSV